MGKKVLRKALETVRGAFARNPERPQVPPSPGNTDPNYVKTAVVGGIVGGVVQGIMEEVVNPVWDFAKEAAPVIGDFFQSLT